MAVTISAHLGIDIAKATFDVALLTADNKIKPKRFDNSHTVAYKHSFAGSGTGRSSNNARSKPARSALPDSGASRRCR